MAGDTDKKVTDIPFSQEDWSDLEDRYQKDQKEQDSIISQILSRLTALEGKVADWVADHLNFKSFVMNALIYNIYPPLNWLSGKVTWILDQINKIYDFTIGKIEDLYNKTFGWYEELRKNVIDITNKIARVAAVFDEKLAENIRTLRDEIFTVLDAYTRDLRDWAVEKIQEYYLPLRSELYEITGAIKEAIRPIRELVDAMEELVPSTIEKPGLLTKKTMYYSGAAYGEELFGGWLEKTTPELTDEQKEKWTPKRYRDWTDDLADAVHSCAEEPWKRALAYLEEEIDEALTGIEKKPRTMIWDKEDVPAAMYLTVPGTFVIPSEMVDWEK